MPRHSGGIRPSFFAPLASLLRAIVRRVSANLLIREMAQGLKGKKPQDVARSAAEQTSATLRSSGFDPVDKGAAAALEAKAGDCSEFSDLMVALLRVREVPRAGSGG